MDSNTNVIIIKSKYFSQKEQALLNRLKKHKEYHLLFLYDFSLPFENNLAEMDLRHVKSKQKVSGRFNNMNSLSVYLNIKSIILTAKKRGLDFYKIFFNAFEISPISFN